MFDSLSLFLAASLKVGAVLLVVNEVRGLILAAPILYGVYQAGGTGTAVWLAICALGGIALSVAVPAFAIARLQKLTRAAEPS